MNNYQETSSFIQGVDWAFIFIIGVGVFFLVGITIVMLFFMLKYRRSKHPIAYQVKEKLWVELTWIIIPLILVMFMFYFGYVAYKPLLNAPANAMHVKTIGKMWEWSFEYDNGKIAKELVIPINKPVKLDLISLDVIHGFFVPAFRIKEDVVPGKINYTWFTPTEFGEFEIMCSAYCGLKHSFMLSKVVVVTDYAFAKWLAGLPITKVESKGLALIKQNACTGCHSLDGTKGVGPSFKGLYGKSETVITNGSEAHVVVDEIYLRRSILKPDDDVVKGFQSGVMHSYRGTINNSEIKLIIEYFKEIK